MNQSTSRRGLRARLPMAPQTEAHFRWRGEHVSRVEGLTDAVFAFAVTLLVMALEGPKNLEGLLDVLRGFPAFIICFAILMTFWNAHFRFHRRYGLEDPLTRVLTMAILVLVLFFVYPLKFLFTFVTVQLFGLALHDAPTLASREEFEVLYVIYGLGFAGVWGLYAALYWRALGQREKLQLTAPELIMTRAALYENLIFIFVCALSIALAVGTTSTSAPGYIYIVLGPLQTLNGWWFGRRVRAAATAG